MSIYKIHSPLGKKVYIGSTTLPLTERFRYHKKDFHRKSRKNYTSCFQLFKEYGIENCLITLLEECHGILAERERFYIENTPHVVNISIPYSSHREASLRWYYKKTGRALPVIKRKKYEPKSQINCDCGGHYRRSNKYQHIKTKRHMFFISQSHIENELYS